MNFTMDNFIVVESLYRLESRQEIDFLKTHVMDEAESLYRLESRSKKDFLPAKIPMTDRRSITRKGAMMLTSLTVAIRTVKIGYTRDERANVRNIAKLRES